MLVNAACAGYRPVPDFDPGDTGEPVPVTGTPLTQVWRSRPVRGPSAPVAVDSLNIYLGGANRQVVAVDLQSGKTRWSTRVPGPVIGGVTLHDSLLYVANDRPGNKVYAFKVASGSEAWSTRIGYVEAPVAWCDGRIIALTRRGEIVALNANDGKRVWHHRLPSASVGPMPLGNGTVLVTSFDSLYTVRVQDGRVLVRRAAPGAVVAPWIRVGDALIAGTGDSLLVAISADSLRETWRVRLDAPLLVSPTARGDTLFGVTRTGSTYRVPLGSDSMPTRLGRSGWPATGAPAVV
ncbi:MAG TPA: PQQ-binding-like beta-propeller repeat protein, partial [Gemmatimonadales bacterium]|nr:PQQ-binding-like beta-propeller repeat protein [Gemmatimonadales bacterium]